MMPSSRYFKKIALLALISALAIVVIVAVSSRRAIIKNECVAPKNCATTGWKISVHDDQINERIFSGHFAPGQLLFAPVGVAFTARSEPDGAIGMFRDRSASSVWTRDGGELNLATPYNKAQLDGAFQQNCRAPLQAGLYRLFWETTDSSAENSILNALILTKAETRAQGNKTWLKVNGKSLGAYHNPLESTIRRVRENARRYQPPLYFATLTQETLKLKLGEDFELGQLVAFKDYHGPDGKKVFTTERHIDVLPPCPELITKLIKLRQRLREQGVKVSRFWITSGFRAPEYNHAIGGAAYSRHCYGDAVDLCIDEDGDKRMDDLNGDGKIDRKDGIIIANACRELEAEGAVALGGIGVYEWDSDDSVRCHVHIDCRGFITRWGQIGAGKYKKSFVWWPKAEFQEDESGE